MYRVISRYNPSFGAHYVVQRREFGYWRTVRHPLGKVMRTRAHAENFMRLLRRKACCFGGCCCGY